MVYNIVIWYFNINRFCTKQSYYNIIGYILCCILYFAMCVYLHVCARARARAHTHTHTHSGILLSHKKGEWNLAICDNLDGPGGLYGSETS